MTNNQKEPKRDSFEKLLKGGSKSVSKRKAKQEKKGKKWLWILSITFFIGLFTFMVPFLIALIWFVLESLVEWMG